MIVFVLVQSICCEVQYRMVFLAGSPLFLLLELDSTSSHSLHANEVFIKTESVCSCDQMTNTATLFDFNHSRRNDDYWAQQSVKYHVQSKISSVLKLKSYLNMNCAKV
jgi:hypothetical protein